MITLILIAALVSCVIYVINKEITTEEFMIMTASTIAGVLLVWSLFLIPIPNDEHFESGVIYKTTYHPYFVEQYQQPHTVCTSTGKTTSCYTYYTTQIARHPEYWTVQDNFSREWKVSQKKHNEVKNVFGNNVKVVRVNKCIHGGHIVSGDPNLYNYWNETNTFDYPVNRKVHWYNPLKRHNTIFTNKSNIKKQYPKSIDYENSNRLIEEEKELTRKDWDIFNSKIYCYKHVNVILTKVKDSAEAKQLEDKWINGKKNDLVITVVGTYKKPEFVKVFGWSESSLVKRKLETYILDNGITRDNLDEVKSIIKETYSPYDYNKFKYLINVPSIWCIFLAFIVACIIGKLLFNEFSTNWAYKDVEEKGSRY